MPRLGKPRNESLQESFHRYERSIGHSITIAESVEELSIRGEFDLGDDEIFRMKCNIMRRAMAEETATTPDGRQHRRMFPVDTETEDEDGKKKTSQIWVDVTTAPYADQVDAMAQYCDTASKSVRKAKRMINILNECYIAKGNPPIQQTFKFRESDSDDDELTSPVD